MDDLIVLARSFDPSRDELHPLKPLLIGTKTYEPGGGPIPKSEFTEEQLRQLIRVRHAIPVQSKSQNKRIKVQAKKAAGFPCPDCDKGPFKSKLNLGAHRRVHKKR